MTQRLPAALAVIGISLALVACGNEVKTGFMEGCTNSGATKAICSCTYGKLEGDFELIQKNPNFAFSTAFQQHQTQALQACRSDS